MTLIGLAMREGARSLVQCINYALIDQYASNGRIATTKPLSDSLDIRHYSLLLPSMQSTTASHTTHDLVKDEQRSILVTDSLHRFEVSRYRRNAAKSLQRSVSLHQ